MASDLGAIIPTKGSGRISSRLLRTNAPRTANENDRAQIACDGRGHVRLSEHRTPSQSCQRGRMFPLRDRWLRLASRLMPHPATGFP
jgi:hypothetical protein